MTFVLADALWVKAIRSGKNKNDRIDSEKLTHQTVPGVGVTRISRICTNWKKMKELLYEEETFKLTGFCMKIHRELGKGSDEIIL